MPRVIGIDPGTVSVDVCGLDEGRVFLDRSLATPDALDGPSALIDLLTEAGRLDLVVGPSGYGLPLMPAQALSDADIRLACLTAEGEIGGIGGLASLLRALRHSALPVVITPGVVHLPSVPAHRKINRVDMGTADKVCAVALAVHQLAARQGGGAEAVSLILLELGGAFTAAVAVDAGRIVDGVGGSSGPIGPVASGALDGEVAFLAGRISKQTVFSGGALQAAGTPDAEASALGRPRSRDAQVALEAYLEGAVKAVASLRVSAPRVQHVLVSGRLADVPGVRDPLADRLSALGLRAEPLPAIAPVSKHAAQGAALLADGLAGGAAARLVETLGIREARGTVLDHLHVVSPESARARLGI
jgi:predicted butyrate kinase (DUF1464 family)